MPAKALCRLPWAISVPRAVVGVRAQTVLSNEYGELDEFVESLCANAKQKHVMKL
jgi:hypothetical protein